MNTTNNNKNLKPLKADAFGTGRWWFRGEPMRSEEVAMYKDEDFMPDGRLKLYKFRGKMAKYTPAMSRDELIPKLKQLHAKWNDLSEPRPEYMEWLASELKPELSNELALAGLTGKTPSIRQGAIRTLLEFTKSKPKQELGITSTVSQPAEPQELMDVFSQVFGVPVTELEKLIRPN